MKNTDTDSFYPTAAEILRWTRPIGLQSGFDERWLWLPGTWDSRDMAGKLPDRRVVVYEHDFEATCVAVIGFSKGVHYVRWGFTCKYGQASGMFPLGEKRGCMGGLKAGLRAALKARNDLLTQYEIDHGSFSVSISKPAPPDEHVVGEILPAYRNGKYEGRCEVVGGLVGNGCRVRPLRGRGPTPVLSAVWTWDMEGKQRILILL